MNPKFLLRRQGDERCYWSRIRADAAGDETVEIYDDVVGTATFVVPADAATLNLIRDGLEQCCFFIDDRELPEKIEAPAAEIVAPTEMRRWMEVQKEQHARAYQPWTEEEDEELRFQWRQTQSSEVLSEHFGRNPSAISSRARKLGLIE